MTRKIIHIDMDAFYAAIEQRDNPHLKGKPIIVGGSPENRGVVSTASYEARRFGIHSAMPTKRAISLCKDLIIIHPNFEKYKTASKSLVTIYREYTDLIEPVSLDECYLDVTENKKAIPTATEIAFTLKERIKKELNLTASAGVAPNKFLAKIASDINKPDGVMVIKPHQVETFIQTLEVKKIWGVGRVTQEKLGNMGVVTCGDLQKYTLDELIQGFGKFGNMLYSFVRGIDKRPVVTHRKVKSVASETTFPVDYLDIDIIKEALLKQTERVSKRLKAKNVKGKTITIKVKYSDFSQITRSQTIDTLTDDLEEIYSTSEKLLDKTEVGKRKVRLIGAAVSNFEAEEKRSDELLFD